MRNQVVELAITIIVVLVAVWAVVRLLPVLAVPEPWGEQAPLGNLVRASVNSTVASDDSNAASSSGLDILTSPRTMRWVLFTVFVTGIIVSRTPTAVGAFLRDFSAQMFP